MSLVTEIIQKGESARIALLPPRTTLSAIGKTVCGMLNQQGGTVLWGVNSDGVPTGVADAEGKCQELIDFLMRNLVQRPLLSVSVELFRQSKLILIEIPSSEDKPYSLNREIWVRMGRQNLRAAEDASYRMVEHAAARESRWGRDFVAGFELADCDRAELAEARHEIAKTERFGIDLPTEDEDLLRRLYLLRNGQYTNAAMVLFASEPLMWSPNLALRIISYAESKQGMKLREQTLTGPAVRVLKQAISVIQQLTGFTGHFKHNRLEREDHPAYPLFALREGLVNAVVHRDYEAVSGQMRVEIYPDHLLIQNPGRLPEGWTGQDIIRKEESHPTNPDIARVFHLRGLMERLGLGGRRLAEECRKLKAKAPVWKADKGVVSLKIFRAPSPNSLTQILPRQKEFLKSLKPGVDFKVDDYALATEVSIRQARRDLGDLCELGQLKRVGKGPSTVYKVVGGNDHE